MEEFVQEFEYHLRAFLTKNTIQTQNYMELDCT